MLGLPASAGAPALAETGGLAVAQLLPPWMKPIEDLTDVTLAIEDTYEDDEDDEEDLTDVTLVSWFRTHY